MYIHVCTFVHTFVIWVPSGPTPPPFVVQKYTWHFCVLGENIDTPPRLYKSIHVTCVLKKYGPPLIVYSKQSNNLKPYTSSKI